MFGSAKTARKLRAIGGAIGYCPCYNNEEGWPLKRYNRDGQQQVSSLPPV
ncbi:MAG: hypothetical protein GDA48_22485 [Hormoscilla sp. GM102CHS1]|nr:hypothetical protein [Hormoscilla sp. GM102CHS1]